MDPQDKRAEKIYQAAQSILQRAGATEAILDEKGEWINETWTVTAIKFKTDNYKSTQWESKDLEVTYEWGLPGGKRGLVDLDAGKAFLIDADEMNDWLNHPTKTFRKW